MAFSRASRSETLCLVELCSLCARYLGRTPRQRAHVDPSFYWLLVDINALCHKVLCYSGVDGVHASVTVGDVDAPMLSV